MTFQRLPTHRNDFVEVYAQEHSDVRMIPDGTDFIVAFVVDDRGDGGGAGRRA